MRTILCFVLALITVPAGADWAYVAVTNDGVRYAYDPMRIARLPDGNVKVWYRVEQTAESKIAEIVSMARQSEDMGAGGRETSMLFRERIPRYKHYSYTLHRAVFDCQQQREYTEESIDYSTRGDELARLNVNALLAELSSQGIPVSNRFSEIYPGSVMEALLLKVCR